MTEKEQEDIDLKIAIYKRFRANFPESTDADFAELIDSNKQNVYRYKQGINLLNILDSVKKFPELNWGYILTGRYDNEVEDYELLRRDVQSVNRVLLKIANKLQEIEDKIPNK